MPFPPHIDRVLLHFGVAPDVKAALYDHWLALGDPSLEAFADGVEAGESQEALVARLPQKTAELYLRRYHHLWQRGAVTQSFWKPRLEGGAGVAMPLGSLPATEGFTGTLSHHLTRLVGPDQPMPSGIVMVSKNGHFGGREETISFDIVVEPLDAAIAVALADGRQHTLPGSVGETSGTVDEEERLALLWEVQPNVLKPAGERNRSIAAQWRRHRNWHQATLAAALLWLREHDYRVAILNGQTLRHAHEVNPEQPISEAIMAHHDRTTESVTTGLGARLEPVDAGPWEALMNHGLRQRFRSEGASGMLRQVLPE